MKTIINFCIFLFSSISIFAQDTPIWSDEFDLDTVDAAKWNFDIGNGSGGWGNNELQYYTSRPENAKIENGVLIITALKESYNGYNYTSARINTKLKAYWKYGRIEMSAKLPKGRGVWPAFWMLPEQKVYGTSYWPDNGEIDIMEYVGYNPGIVYGSVHTDQNYGANSVTRSITYSGVEDNFHVFAIEWTPDMIKFYVDNYYYANYARSGRTWNYWPFDQNFFVLLNLAIGGNWGGAQGIDDAIFPQTYQIDYVRVYDLGVSAINDFVTNKEKISISPNPNKGNFKLYIEDSNLKNNRVSVYDSNGKMVVSPVNCKTGYSDFNLNQLDPGIYLLMIQNNQESRTIKFLKE